MADTKYSAKPQPSLREHSAASLAALGAGELPSGPEALGEQKCRSILVVEDEASIRETLRYALEMEGYNVYTAANGQEGIDLLASIPKPCLILLDLMMPVMDGWGFVEAIDKDMMLTKIPVVVVTAFSDKLKTVKARGVIKKPVDLDALCQVAKQWCSPATSEV